MSSFAVQCLWTKQNFIQQTLATSLSHNTINGQQIRQLISLLTQYILGGKPCVLIWKRTALQTSRDDCYVSSCQSLHILRLKYGINIWSLPGKTIAVIVSESCVLCLTFMNFGATLASVVFFISAILFSNLIHFSVPFSSAADSTWLSQTLTSYYCAGRC